jgi:hypothetical protein
MNVLYHVEGKEKSPDTERAAHLKMVDMNVPLQHRHKLNRAIMDLVQVVFIFIHAIRSILLL